MFIELTQVWESTKDQKIIIVNLNTIKYYSKQQTFKGDTFTEILFLNEKAIFVNESVEEINAKIMIAEANSRPTEYRRYKE